MNWKSRVIYTTIFAQCIAGQSCGGKEHKHPIEKQKPNILFILADDQCYETVRSLGNTEIHTPNLDRLVSSGTTFTHAYNMGGWNGAISTASRSMFNTGLFLWKSSKGNLKKKSVDPTTAGLMRDKEQLWSQRMSSQGYETYFAGKWHVKGVTSDEVFDHAKFEKKGMPKQTAEGYYRPQLGVEDLWSPSDTTFGGFWQGGKHWSEVLRDIGEEYILNHKSNSKKPFFMYLGFNAPHDPRQSPQEYVDMYPLDSIAVPSSFQEEYPDAETICGRKLRDERLAPYPRTPYSIKVNRQEYYAIITHMDAQIGRILEALDKSGQAENTYIFFTADHGLAVGNHGLMGKQNMYDHSIRSPFILTGPDVPRGKLISHDIYIQDAMASSLELAYGEEQKDIDFRSVMPLIRGDRIQNYESIYGAYINRQRMIRSNGYKLILYPQKGIYKLFDLQIDPYEVNNIAHNPEHKERIKSMYQELKLLQKNKYKDPLSLDDFYPELMKYE